MGEAYDIRKEFIRKKSIRALIAGGRTPLGLYISLPCPAIAEYAALAGFDYVMIDAEHHLFNPETIAGIARACDAFGIAATVRTSQRDAITAMLDFGITGFKVPHVHTAAEVEELVRLIKYAPVGERGFCSGGRAEHYGVLPFSEYYKRAEENFLMVMIEDREGIRNMEEILAVPGLDFVAAGSGDISQALGCLSETNNAEVIRTVEKIYRTADKYGVLHAGNGAPVNEIDDKSIILPAMKRKREELDAIYHPER